MAAYYHGRPQFSSATPFGPAALSLPFALFVTVFQLLLLLLGPPLIIRRLHMYFTILVEKHWQRNIIHKKTARVTGIPCTPYRRPKALGSLR